MHRNDQRIGGTSDSKTVTVIDMATGQVAASRAGAGSTIVPVEAVDARSAEAARTNTLMFRHGSPLMPRTRVGPRGAGPIVWPVGFDEMFADGVQDRWSSTQIKQQLSTREHAAFSFRLELFFSLYVHINSGAFGAIRLQQDFTFYWSGILAWMEHVLPAEVREFASQNLESVAQLEALLLMRREQDVEWTRARLAKRLYVQESEAGMLLEGLRTRGLLGAWRNEGAAEIFKYSPVTPELDRLVAATAEAHSKYLIQLTHFVHTHATTAAHRFANAFRLRDKK